MFSRIHYWPSTLGTLFITHEALWKKYLFFEKMCFALSPVFFLRKIIISKKMAYALSLSGSHMSSYQCENGIQIDSSPPLSYSHVPTPWESLTGKTISSNYVILSKYGDIHPFHNGPIFLCETLMLNRCDKNFLRYWFKSKTFPNVKTVYIGSHPGDWYVLNDKDMDIFLTEGYFNWYYDRWWSEKHNIKSISQLNYDAILNSLKIEIFSLDVEKWQSY